ncbi:unnamed protein product [Spirodela intermedia]|uniref:Uncharacterized protein n=1 Tax=Spirodela intermedia TaxID=51605 RepID=A0A7I8L4T8_SPIIN|nr:unnamed protein product [Spirodela intermedia]
MKINLCCHGDIANVFMSVSF